MTRKVMPICWLALAYAGTLRTDNPTSTAVSYSSIRFGTPTIENNSAQFEYGRITPIYDSLLLNAEDRYKVDGTQQTDKTLKMANLRNFQASSSSNVYSTPTYTETTFPQYIPSGSRILNLAKPTSRNIPESPSPEFDSVPSVLKTKGLSAYASTPIQTSATKVQYTPVSKSKGLSIFDHTSSIGDQPVQFLEAPVSQFHSAPYVGESRELSAFPSEYLNVDQPQVSHSENPVVSHVSVSSLGTNYSW